MIVCSLTALLVAQTPQAHAADRTWAVASTTTGDWFIAANWSPSDNYPQAGDAAIITNGYVLLTNTSAALASFSITNATLIFSNWDTTLSATNVTILNNGVMTLPPAFTTNGMSNRVSVVCSNFILGAGGQINVNSKGYQIAQGPGKGNQFDSNNNSGGGHGGRGGDEGTGVGGVEYDSTNAPVNPGSGGGEYTAQPNLAGAGGGVVRIQATNVTVSGTISANGEIGAPYNAGGSGGAIYITCATFAGTSGVLRANGGEGGIYYNGGGGGGGRIAVIYQNVAGSPSVQFSTTPGALYYYEPGGMGTLYLPDTALVATNTLDRFYNVRLIIPGFTNWSVASLNLSNTVVGLGELNGFSLTVTNDMVLGTNTWLTLGAKPFCAFNGSYLANAYSAQGITTGPATNPMVTVGGNTTINNGGALTLGGISNLSQIVMNVGSNLTLNGASMKFGGLSQNSNSLLNVGGALTLTNGARLWVYSGLSNAVENYGASIIVTGMVYIAATNSWIYPYSHPANGGSPYFQFFNDLFIGNNAGFNAGGAGYPAGAGPGKGTNSDSNLNSGGGHGGRGGNSSAYDGGPTNGSANAPISAGSGGGRYDSNGGDGGGSIRIEAKQIVLNGALNANANTNSGSYNAGGAGGSIYLICDSFSGGNSALLCATGGPRGAAYTTLGGGGGGRIAVWVNVSPSLRTRYVSGEPLRSVVRTTTWSQFTGTLSVTNGTGWSNGMPGTVFFFESTKGTQFIVY